jgi:hypothetical protein
MEVLTDLKSPHPIIISNAEVLEMLEKSVKRNKERLEAIRTRKRLLRRRSKKNAKKQPGVATADQDDDDVDPNNNNSGSNVDDDHDDNDNVESRFQHRDWIEEMVLQYLKGTPCVNIPTARIPELKSILMASKRSRTATAAASTTTRTAGDHGNDNSNRVQDRNASTPSTEGGGAAKGNNITRAGFDLTEAESIQVLNDRMSERQQDELLDLIRSYSIAASATGAAGAGASSPPGVGDDIEEEEDA